MQLNDGHQTQFLTAAHLLAVLFDEAFGRESAGEMCRLNPGVAELVERIGGDLGALYQAIGNAAPWHDEAAPHG